MLEHFGCFLAFEVVHIALQYIKLGGCACRSLACVVTFLHAAGVHAASLYLLDAIFEWLSPVYLACGKIEPPC